MDRPFPVEAAALAASTAAPARRPEVPPLIKIRRGAAILGAALAAAVLGAAFGHAAGFAIGALLASTREMASQYAHALAFLIGGSAALAMTLRQIGPTVLRDRMRGCAWFGAPDPAVSHAFLFGGAIAVVDSLVLTHPAPAQSDWLVGPAMLLAFAAIAVAPVLEELLLRGVVFAMLRARVTTPIAAITAALASAPIHLLGVVPQPSSALGAIAIGVCAMGLRLRHASLAPAIAVNCGAAFIRCVLSALG